MLYCKLCEEEIVILHSLCESCRKIKHYMNIYTKPRIIEILDNILSRDIQKQNNKIKAEITQEIRGKEKTITNLNDSSYYPPPTDEELKKAKKALKNN